MNLMHFLLPASHPEWLYALLLRVRSIPSSVDNGRMFPHFGQGDFLLEQEYSQKHWEGYFDHGKVVRIY